MVFCIYLYKNAYMYLCFVQLMSLIRRVLKNVFSKSVKSYFPMRRHFLIFLLHVSGFFSEFPSKSPCSDGLFPFNFCCCCSSFSKSLWTHPKGMPKCTLCFRLFSEPKPTHHLPSAQGPLFLWHLSQITASLSCQ